MHGHTPPAFASPQVDKKIVADKYKTVMTEFKKTARFPGFRVGTIPPFMLDKVKQFVILESLEKVSLHFSPNPPCLQPSSFFIPIPLSFP